MRIARPEVPFDAGPEIQAEPIDVPESKPKNAFVEGVKNVGRSGYEMAGRVLDFNSHADWVGERYADVKNVAKGWWKESVVETVRMNTVDKWKLVKQQKKSNIFIKHKAQEIADIKGRWATEEQNLERYHAIKEEDDARFGKSVTASQDPTIRGIFKKTWGEKTARTESNITNSQALIGYFDDTSLQYARDIVRFQEKVDEAGALFGERLDTRIEKIRKERGYYRLQDKIEKARGQVELGEHWDRYYDEKIAEYSSAVVEAQSLGVSKADCQIILNGITKFKREKKSNARLVKLIKWDIERDETQIGYIDEKTARYQNMKRDLGLDQPSMLDRSVVDNGTDEDEIDSLTLDESGAEMDVDNEEEAEDDETVSDDDADDGETKGDDVETEDEDQTESGEQHERNQRSSWQEVPFDDEKVPDPEYRENVDGVESRLRTKDTGDNENPIPIDLPEENVKNGPQEALVQDKEDDTQLEESENVEANREAAVESLSKKIDKLSKLLTGDGFQKGAAIELYSATMGVGKVVAEYEELLSPEEDHRLSEGFAHFQKKYNQRYVSIDTIEETRQLKKDIINMIMRRLPDWFFKETD